jgi:FlaA1/EpsC-like NDP-sugar epimerase
MSVISIASKNIINLPRYAKRTIAIILDFGLCILCTWLAFYLRLEQFVYINDITILAAIISIVFAIPIFWLTGLYKNMLRFVGSSIILTVFVAIINYSLLYFAIIGIYGIQGIPRSIGVLQPVLLFLTISSSRIIIKYLFAESNNFKNSKIKKNILIYGAGAAGRQILAGLENNPEMKVVGFLDDDEQFHRQIVLGQTVYDPLKIDKLINKKKS